MDKRKEEIVEVALRRFAHYGFSKTTMNEVAEDLKITKANLYYYYPDKASLIKDVIYFVARQVYESENALIEKYDNNLLEILFAVLQLRAEYMRKYYVLHINENLEWIKGLNLDEVIDSFFKRDVDSVCKLFAKAKEAGELVVSDIKAASVCYVEIVKGLGILCNVSDIMTGIPNEENVDKILDSQKRATQFIFKEKIVTK